MEVVILQLFVSLLLVVGSVLLFAFAWRQRDFDHADRLALLPVEEEPAPRATSTGAAGADEAVAPARTPCASPPA